MSEQEQTIDNQSPPSGNDDGATSEAQVEEKVTQDNPPQQPVVDPLEDHKERSGLGRKMAKYEQELNSMRQTISQLTSVLSARQNNAISQVDDVPPVEYITTPEDLEKYEAWKADKQERQRNTYANNYVHSIKMMSYVNPDMHDAIENELLTNVNEYPTYSKYVDPVSDAKQNYLKAENKLLKQQLAGGQPIVPNVRGGNNAPTGVTSVGRTTVPPKATIQLDDYAAKFLRSIGETTDSEWVQKSIARKE